MRPLASQINLPCSVGDLIDNLISHSEIVAIWEPEVDNGYPYKKRLWRGIAREIPTKLSKRIVDRICGIIPESITESDTINIVVIPLDNSRE